jgi:hypothetical protein
MSVNVSCCVVAAFMVLYFVVMARETRRFFGSGARARCCYSIGNGTVGYRRSSARRFK